MSRDGQAKRMTYRVGLNDRIAVVLYGIHYNSTLLDPDEVDILNALAKAAATSH
jgi:hypothetical protein